MFTENGVLVDLEELRKVVDDSDVFTVGFRLFPERFIVDTRSTGSEIPMAEVVEPVATVEERFFWLGKRRPAFSAPERFTFFVWPHSIRFLQESGIAGRIRERVGAAGHDESARVLDAAMARLSGLEKVAVVNAITGENCHTIWPQEV
ncbi:MAG: hypothetical protein ACE5FA_10910 [Dehalococcoidia bacterium]